MQNIYMNWILNVFCWHNFYQVLSTLLIKEKQSKWKVEFSTLGHMREKNNVINTLIKTPHYLKVQWFIHIVQPIKNISTKLNTTN